jgi:4-amino-4-deoxy-L-arabinose transferase-like glycosyltransferase
VSARQTRCLLVIVAAAVGVRAAWAVYAARPPLTGDPMAYIFYGQSIAGGHGYRNIVTTFQELARLDQPGAADVVTRAEPTAYYPIGYPAALAGLFWAVIHTPIPDNFPRVAAFFNVALGAGTILLTFELARRLFDVRVGLVAAAIQSAFPSLVFYTGIAFTETLFNFCVMAALLVAVSAPWPASLSRRRLVLFGAVLGVSALVRPFSLWFLPALAVVWLLRGLGWRRVVVQLAWVALATALVLLPWTVRNIIQMDSLVFISTNVGDGLCIDRHPDANGGFTNSLPYCAAGYEGLPSDVAEVRRNRDNIRRSVEWVIDHPLTELRHLFWRAHVTLQHDHDVLESVESNGADRFMHPRTRAVFESVSDGYFFAALALGLLGLPAFIGRQRDGRRLFLVFAMGALAAVPLVLYGYPRFHVPVLPPLTIVAAVPLVAFRSSRRDDHRLLPRLVQSTDDRASRDRGDVPATV